MSHDSLSMLDATLLGTLVNHFQTPVYETGNLLSGCCIPQIEIGQRRDGVNSGEGLVQELAYTFASVGFQRRTVVQ